MKAGNVIKPMKAPVVGDWVSAADMGGGDGVNTGTNVIESAALILNFPDVAFHTMSIEVNYTATKVSGTLGVLTWIKGRDIFHLTATSSASASDQFLPSQRTGGTKDRVHVISLPRPQGNNIGSDPVDRYVIYIMAAGESADAVWTVTNIQARLRYVPL